eukprot:2315387-Pyramimonas_sp.AAC.1
MVQEVQDCDAILVQETRLLEGRSRDAEAQLRSQGWRARSSPAVRSEPGGLSTGGAHHHGATLPRDGGSPGSPGGGGGGRQ